MSNYGDAKRRMQISRKVNVSPQRLLPPVVYRFSSEVTRYLLTFCTTPTVAATEFPNANPALPLLRNVPAHVRGRSVLPLGLGGRHIAGEPFRRLLKQPLCSQHPKLGVNDRQNFGWHVMRHPILRSSRVHRRHGSRREKIVCVGML